MHVHSVMRDAFDRQPMDFVIVAVTKSAGMQRICIVVDASPFNMGKQIRHATKVSGFE